MIETLDDGYGDRLSFPEIEQIILGKERLSQIMVSERNDDPGIRDDLLNECRIAIWEVLSKRPDAPPAYIHAAMKMRITEVLMRGVWFGMEGHRGKAIDPIRRKDRDSLDDPDWEVVVEADDMIERILLAYHEGEILSSIRELPQKHQQYIVMRFWGGLSHAEIAAMIGGTTPYMSDLWVRSIRPRLQESLGHLEGAAI